MRTRKVVTIKFTQKECDAIEHALQQLSIQCLTSPGAKYGARKAIRAYAKYLTKIRRKIGFISKLAYQAI